MDGGVAPLSSASDGQMTRQRFGFAEQDESAGGAYVALRRIGRGMGIVWLVAGLLLLVFGPGSTFGRSTTLWPVVLGLILLGVAFVALSFVAGGKRALSATIDDGGVEVVMSRPPNWSMRWSDPGAWVDLSRGYQKGTEQEQSSRGWGFTAHKFSTTVGFSFGLALALAAQAKGFRVADVRSGAKPGRIEFEFLTMDYPTNPERHKQHRFR